MSTEYRTEKLGLKLSDRAVDMIVKKRLSQAGYDQKQFSAHSIRSGFLTQAGREGIALGDAMQVSCHTTPAVAQAYFRAGELLNNPAAHLYPTDTPDSVTGP